MFIIIEDVSMIVKRRDAVKREMTPRGPAGQRPGLRDTGACPAPVWSRDGCPAWEQGHR